MVVWDGDGTLWDSRQVQQYAHNQTREDLGVPTLTQEQICQRMGGRSVDAFADIPARIGQKDVRELYYGHYYRGVRDGGIVAREGALEAVESLTSFGFKQVISTHGWRFVTPSLVAANIPPSYFCHRIDAYTITALGIRGKPYADPFVCAAVMARISTQRAVMVGDMPSDVLSGQGYGISDELRRKKASAAATIAIRGGCAQDRDLLAARPAYVVDHPYSVPERVICALSH